MPYCPSKAVFLGPTATTYANPFVTVRTSVVRTRAVAVAQRRRPVSHRTKLIPCKAISKPAPEEMQQLQGSKLQLPYEVLEHAYAQQKLEGQKLERALHETQARLELSEAIEQKARRVCRKVASSSKKMSSRARLLQTQFDRLTSETDTDKLQTTVDEQDHRLSCYQVEAEGYKQKMLRAQEETKREVRLQKTALAEKAAAEKAAQDLETLRQQVLQSYHEMVNTEQVFGQLLFEMLTATLFAPLMTTSEQASGEKQVSSRLADERTAQQAHFL